MTTTSASPPLGYQKTGKDPNTAAFMSVIPGLGQLYNGQTRKGVLFLAVDLINLIVLSVLVFTGPIVQAFAEFGVANHIRPNPSLRYALSQLHLGSPPSIVLIGMMVAFIAFAMRDAYDHAAHVHRRSLYPEYVMEMPEATSGSYLFHFTMLVLGFLLAFFFLVPPPPSRQVTDIEFVQNQPPVKHHVVSQRKAEHNSEDAGKHKPEPVTPPSPAPKAPSQPTPKAQPQPQKTPTPIARPSPHPSPRPTPIPAPHPAPTPSPHPSPVQAPHPAPSPSPSPRPSLVPTPFVHPSASPNPNPSPFPAPSRVNTSGSPSPAPAPKVGAPGAGAGATGPSATQVALGSGASGGTTPIPVPVGGGSPNRGGGGGPAPAPSRARFTPGGGGGGGGAALMTPVVGRPRADGGDGMTGNPGENSNPKGAPSVAAEQNVDFGPYMADLQRRIKRAWFPPRGQENRRVVVIFKVHKQGELSNLRLATSSGNASADKAAMSAVENAAPFRPLPSGSSDDVDIQFTFDYNVFSGGGGGHFRSF